MYTFDMHGVAYDWTDGQLGICLLLRLGYWLYGVTYDWNDWGVPHVYPLYTSIHCKWDFPSLYAY